MLLQTGQITFPSREVDLLREIRRGGRTQEWVINECKLRMDELEIIGKSNTRIPVADEIDRDRVSKILSDTYQTYWSRKGDQ